MLDAVGCPNLDSLALKNKGLENGITDRKVGSLAPPWSECPIDRPLLSRSANKGVICGRKRNQGARTAQGLTHTRNVCIDFYVRLELPMARPKGVETGFSISTGSMSLLPLASL
jgi:hypothetical protein